MFDKFVFSNGQALGALDGTGVISTNYLDMEYDDAGSLIKTDAMVECWLNFVILSTTNAGGTEGMQIQLIESDATAGTTPSYLGIIRLLLAEIAAGNMFSIGISKQCTKRYLSVWYLATSTALTLLTSVDAWISTAPLTSPTYRCQKKPA
jgi:hypothetical protein